MYVSVVVFGTFGFKYGISVSQSQPRQVVCVFMCAHFCMYTKLVYHTLPEKSETDHQLWWEYPWHIRVSWFRRLLGWKRRHEPSKHTLQTEFMHENYDEKSSNKCVYHDPGVFWAQKGVTSRLGAGYGQNLCKRWTSFWNWGIRILFIYMALSWVHILG
jgi:hypothetical protein